MKKRINTFIMITAIMLSHGAVAHGLSIVNSKHNLSASNLAGQGTIKATTESEVCIFCHTPHNANVNNISYLWNRSIQTTTYTPYTSSTMKATEGHIGSTAQPTRASKLCLSCHDGTIGSAMGTVLSRPSISFIGGVDTLSGRSTSLGTDLSDDHPVSFNYQSSITLGNTELAPASTLTSSVKLDSTGQLQCTACHDPHDNFYGKFLVMSNEGSALCTSCHLKTNWSLSSHSISLKTWNGTAPDPWPTSSYTTVATNGCGNCHRPHSAATGEERLLNYAVEETNCLVCHNGNVAEKNISADLAKTYRHPVSSVTGVHDPAEKYSLAVDKHVECADCHNPHQVNSSTPGAPLVPGRLKGVPGVDFASNAYLSSATYEYQVCFKCHGASINNVLTTPQPIVRYWTNTRDNRVKFNSSNVSYHPVIAPLNKISANMLILPWAKGSMLYCTDCHGSDSSGAKGSHGSIYPHILVKKYETSVVSPTSSTAYLTDNALCFKCHNATTLIGNLTKFRQHNGHLRTGTLERCSYCHDPHGNPINEGMINFQMYTDPGTDRTKDIVTLSGGKPIQLFYPLGPKNTCLLTCHGVVHGS